MVAYLYIHFNNFQFTTITYLKFYSWMKIYMYVETNFKN